LGCFPELSVDQEYLMASIKNLSGKSYKSLKGKDLIVIFRNGSS